MGENTSLSCLGGEGSSTDRSTLRALMRKSLLLKVITFCNCLSGQTGALAVTMGGSVLSPSYYSLM